jgi:hypothetical protein
MESMFWRVVTSLGVPGLALGMFYKVIVNLQTLSAPPEWVGPLLLLTLCLTSAITFYALGPRNATNIIDQLSEQIPKDRADALNATWKGILTQASRLETQVELTLKVTGKKIGGEMECVYYDIGKQKFDVSGSFHRDRLLKLDYVNKDKTTVHFGTSYFELSANGKKLIGSCVGFGIVAEHIVTADFKLIRQLRP